MLYNKFKPDPVLAPFVECYYQWEGIASDPVTVQSPPNGYAAIVFNVASPYTASQGSDIVKQVPRAFVSGQFTANYRLHLHGTISSIGAVLKPATIHNFFGIRMSELVNTRASLSFLPGLDEDVLWERINLAPTVSDRISVLEDLLKPHIATGKSNLTIIDEAIDFIDHAKGCITVDALATHLGISRRYLEKRFQEKVGISPKYYARIKRFSILSNEIAHSKRIDWQHVVSHYGFHDQSHLVKEFLEFNQMNPTQYHLLHQEMIRLVKN